VGGRATRSAYARPNRRTVRFVEATGPRTDTGIGIAVGFATCGEIGFEGRTEYTAIGTVVNLAARICGIATGGQILVTNKVHAALEEREPAVAVGDHEFKGLSRPVPLFEVAPLRQSASNRRLTRDTLRP